MSKFHPHRSRLHRAIAPTTLLLTTSLIMAGCAQGLGNSNSLALNPTGSIQSESLPDVATAAANKSDAADMANLPAKTAKAIASARRERAAGRDGKAMSLLDAAAKSDAESVALHKERGLLALQLGQLKKAEKLLRKAADTGSPDWRVHSGLGSVLAARGKQQDAQAQFAKALEIAPDHPSVLNNLALSYALDGQHQQAEQLLRRAAKGKNAKLQTKQNLALLLGLDGKVDEAQRITQSALPKTLANANSNFLNNLQASAKKVSRDERKGAVGIQSAQSAN